MLKIATVSEIKRLLDEGELSKRQIARQLGVSRTTVTEIAKGRRGLHGRETEVHVADEDQPPTRCPICGDLVIMPCVACRARDFLARKRRLIRCNCAHAEPSCRQVA